MDPPPSDDELYRQGSQYRLWSFTRQGLQDARQAVNQQGREKIKREHAGVPPPDGPTQPRGEFPSVEDEAELVRWYAERTLSLTQSAWKLPSHARATAVSYVKRFYLRHSVMEFLPKAIMYTSIFLATKAENIFISIENFVEPVKTDIDAHTILALEFTVAQALSFTLLVHHPYNPVHGYFLDMQDVFFNRAASGGKPRYSMNELGNAHDAARRFVNDSMLSDAAFLYTPPQIGLAALAHADEALAEAYMVAKFGGSEELLERLRVVVAGVRECVLAAVLRLGSVSFTRSRELEEMVVQCRPLRTRKRRLTGGTAGDDRRRALRGGV
ncbi:cyclin-like protein [Limtongia smithiae]|uniref:cyclin-like protein n=1 Tax=Limtongia smithiae TaxID=1125753 RepID=UPI0034CEBC2C